jgi:hypothetical protein
MIGKKNMAWLLFLGSFCYFWPFALFSLQVHGSYYFKNLIWVSINTTWFNGGKTLIDNTAQESCLIIGVQSNLVSSDRKGTIFEITIPRWCIHFKRL